MNTGFYFTLSPKAALIATRIGDEAGVRAVIARETDKQNQLTIAHVQLKYLSFPAHGPTVENGLRVISNRLRSSIHASKAQVSGAGIVSSIGSNVKYAAVHEFGFDGTVHVKSFTRHDARAFVGPVHPGLIGPQKPGKRKTKPQPSPTGLVTVKAHDRHMHMPERSPIRNGIRDRLPKYGQAISAAIIKQFGGAS